RPATVTTPQITPPPPPPRPWWRPDPCCVERELAMARRGGAPAGAAVAIRSPGRTRPELWWRPGRRRRSRNGPEPTDAARIRPPAPARIPRRRRRCRGHRETTRGTALAHTPTDGRHR